MKKFLGLLLAGAMLASSFTVAPAKPPHQMKKHYL